MLSRRVGPEELSAGPGRVKIWDVKTGAKRLDLPGLSRAHAVAFSPDSILLAGAGRWRNDAEAGTGAFVWNASNGTPVRSVLTDPNGSAHAVSFSPDGKLIAISSLYYDVDKANDAGTGAISLAKVGSGIVQWRRTFAGLAKPVAFYSGAVLLLSEGRMARLLDEDTGKTLAQIHLDPRRGGRWNDFAIVKRGGMWVIGGEDDSRRGTVEIIDASGPEAPAKPAPAKGGEK